jgi:hypothetical protein
MNRLQRAAFRSGAVVSILTAVLQLVGGGRAKAP